MTPMPDGAVDRLVSQKEAALVLGMAVSTLRASREIPYVMMPGSRTGGRSLSPVRMRGPPAAHSTRSAAAQCARGPVWPKAVIETYTSAGLTAARSS